MSDEFSKYISKRNLERSLWILIAVVVCLGILFFGNRPVGTFCNGYRLDNELWGNFGVFFGGVVGTLLAFLGVVITCLVFIGQSRLSKNLFDREEARENRFKQEQELRETTQNEEQKQQAEMQRFNDLFFELINIHNSQKEILYNTPLHGFNTSISPQRDYFIRFMEELKCNCISKSRYGGRAKEARNKYLQLYLNNAAEIAPYFRTLYRIFDLIDNAQIDEKEKVRYAKIARAMLSEGELFALRYNAYTVYGKNFAHLINKYRLIKHLPFFSLAEWNKTAAKLASNTPVSQHSISMLLADISHKIFDATVDKNQRTDHIKLYAERKKYKLELNMQLKYLTTIILTIDNQAKNTDPVLAPLKNFTPIDFQEMFYDFLQEIYKFSNFRRYNPDKGTDYNSKITSLDTTGVTKVVCWVRSKDAATPLRLSHPSNDEFYNL